MRTGVEQRTSPKRAGLRIRHVERDDQEVHCDRDRAGNTAEAERGQILHGYSDEMAGGQLCQPGVAEPARKHVEQVDDDDQEDDCPCAENYYIA